MTPLRVPPTDAPPTDAPSVEDLPLLDAGTPEDASMVIDKPAVTEVVVFDLPAVDEGPDCIDGESCSDNVGPCEIGRTRCEAGRPVCRAAGNQLPGTACMGGTCDGRGSCVASMQRSCPMPSENGCGLVFLSGGAFTLGDTGGYRASPPQRAITVSAFALDAYEVTVARFRRFWDAGRPAPTRGVAYPDGVLAWRGTVNEPTSPMERCNWATPERESHPLNCVDWWTAQAFCVWDGARLPTEAEWEFAARQHLAAGLSPNRRHPWGDALPLPGCDRAQWNNCPGSDGAATRRVGSFGASAGFFDLAGNVWEWTGDLFASYDSRACWGGATRTDPRCATNDTGFPTIRGGSWFSMSRTLLEGAARDDAYRPNTRSALVGFRCARTRRE